MFAVQKLSVLKFCNPIENTIQLSKENNYQRNTTLLQNPPIHSGGFNFKAHKDKIAFRFSPTKYRFGIKNLPLNVF